MISQIAYQQIAGIPMVGWGGITTLILMLITAIIAWLNLKGIRFLGIKWHKIFAAISIIAGLAHGTIAILAYKGF